MGKAVQAKRCQRCHETKPLEEFDRRTESRDGRQSMCKPCRRDYQRGYDAKKSELGEMRIGLDRAIELLTLECEQSVVRVRRAADRVIEEAALLRRARASDPVATASKRAETAAAGTDLAAKGSRPANRLAVDVGKKGAR